MLKNAFVKDIVKDIKKTKGRFISILAIIALGVAFFSGVKVSPIDMKGTVDKYYDDYNFMDLTLYSTLGFTDDDISEIKKVQGVLDAFPTYSLDAIVKIDSQEKVLKVMGKPLNNKSNLNDYVLMEGRFPKKDNECVIEDEKIESLGLEIGDKISLSSGISEDLSEKLNNVEYEVVGKVRTPNYLSIEKGSSSIGDGKVSSFIVIPQENFNIPAFTEVYVTVNGAKELNSYSKKYFNLTDKTKSPMEELGKDRAKIRYDEVVAEATKKLNDGKKELEEQKNKGEADLSDTKKKIEELEKQLEDGLEELTKKENEFNTSMANAENEIATAQDKINTGKVELEAGKATFENEKSNATNQINIAKENLANLKSTKLNLENKINQIELALKNPSLSEDEKAQLNIQLQTLIKNNDEVNKNIEYISNEIKAGEEKLIQGKAQIDSKEAELINGERSLSEKKNELEAGKATATREFQANKLKLEDGKKELEKGIEEYEEGKKTFEKEISSAEAKIEKAENDIKDIKEPSWYILDRESNYSYVDYKNNADSIDKLAKVFPVFFFLVAALVCLTTMTRMVDEQRINIGTLKALGYSKGKIISKYLIYSFSASFLGSVVGLAIGFTLFPIIVTTAYEIMYSLPKAQLEFNIPLAVFITTLAILVTTLASFSACYKELMETPSSLMRPKAPKEGKRILIERIDFIWNNLSFIGKVTVRNIFRYKKRFLMTVFGIAGCTALIVTGFGIKDSIKTIVSKQFGDIFKYNLTVSIDKDAGNIDKGNVYSYINNLQGIDNSIPILNENVKIATEDGEKDIYLIATNSPEELKNFIDLRNRKSKENLILNDNGIILSEKVAKQAKVKVGDDVKVKINNKEALLRVEGIAENYTLNYLYITETYYKDKFDKNPNFNSILVNTRKEVNEEGISKSIIENSLVRGVSSNTSMKDNFDNTIKNLNYVVLILIISAGALAFVVLYNLTNVNISERMREIATIKVLGFYNNEVSAYIYRENIILTLFGILFGEFLGVLLHRFIMITVELDTMMFGRNIDLISYLISAMLTILFSLLVNWVMYYKLKGIKMVESLKSVD